jgi:hypothetical protein
LGKFSNLELNKAHIKLAIIILNIAIIYSLIVFNGLIDSFAPKHIVEIGEIIKNSHLSGNHMTDQVPGFYVYGAVIKLIINNPLFGLLTYPIQMIPYLVVFYTFIYKISASHLLASVITLIQIISGTDGSSLFFLAHGIGTIIYYTLLLSLILLIFKSNVGIGSRILIIICGISLVFISYNIYAITIIFLFVFVVITMIMNLKNPNIQCLLDGNNKSLLNMSFILLVVQMGLSKFLYQSFIPTLKQSTSMELTAIDKFLIAYFQTESLSHQTVISDLLITYPQEITFISLIKYSILLLPILIFIYLFLRKYRLCKEVIFFDQLTITFVVSYFLYGIIRVIIGGSTITLLYVPGILCIIWIYRYTTWKSFAIFSILLILFLAPVYTISMNSVAPKENIHETEYIKSSSHWYFENMNIDVISVSDELTRNLFQFYIYQGTSHLQTVSIIKSDQISFLLQNSTITQSQNNYYILNYKSSSMSIQQWRIIKSWKYSKSKIDTNNRIFKIFDADYLSIYY